MGIKYYDPTSGDVSKLANRATNSKYVVTIDTALAHICASVGKKCILALPHFYDERWIRYMESNCMYRQNCEFVIQKEDGSWREDIKGLTKKLNLRS